MRYFNFLLFFLHYDKPQGHINHMSRRAGDHTFDWELFACMWLTEMCNLGGVVTLCAITTEVIPTGQRAEQSLNW